MLGHPQKPACIWEISGGFSTRDLGGYLCCLTGEGSWISTFSLDRDDLNETFGFRKKKKFAFMMLSNLWWDLEQRSFEGTLTCLLISLCLLSGGRRVWILCSNEDADADTRAWGKAPPRTFRSLGSMRSSKCSSLTPGLCQRFPANIPTAILRSLRTSSSGSSEGARVRFV